MIQVERLMKEYAAKDKPVAGVIVEPIQAEGGDNYASAEYFRQLQQICKDVRLIQIYHEIELLGALFLALKMSYF